METTVALPASAVAPQGCMMVLSQIFKALRIATGVGEDVSELLYAMSMLVPRPVVQEALYCIDHEGVIAFHCMSSGACFHIVKRSPSRMFHLMYRGNSSSLSRSSTHNRTSHEDLSVPSVDPSFFLITPDFCSCEGTECAEMAVSDGITYSCAHRMAVELAEALDYVEQRHVLEAEHFSRLLFTYSYEVMQDQYST